MVYHSTKMDLNFHQTGSIGRRIMRTFAKGVCQTTNPYSVSGFPSNWNDTVSRLLTDDEREVDSIIVKDITFAVNQQLPSKTNLSHLSTQFAILSFDCLKTAKKHFF